MKVDLFDFDLPQDRIALRPVRPRDAAKMLLVRSQGEFVDRCVRDLPELLNSGDVLVLNDTRVIPAQLEGRRAGGEAKIGATLHKRIDLRRWQAFVRNAKRIKLGDTLVFGGGVTAIAEARHPNGSMTLQFEGEEAVEQLRRRYARYARRWKKTDSEKPSIGVTQVMLPSRLLIDWMKPRLSSVNANSSRH